MQNKSTCCNAQLLPPTQKKQQSETASLAVTITVRQLISQSMTYCLSCHHQSGPIVTFTVVLLRRRNMQTNKKYHVYSKIKGRDIKSDVGVEKWC